MLAKQMGLAESSIRLVENDVGGGFGARGEFYPEDFLIPFAARLTGRPVKWIEDRREHLLATQPCARSRVRAGDRLRARRHDPRRCADTLHADHGRLYPHQRRRPPARNVAQVLSGPYRIPNIHIDVALMMTNKTPVGHLSRAGPLRGRFLPRAAVRHRGEGSRHRPRRVPAAQSRRRSGDAVYASPPSRRSTSTTETRQRRLSAHARSLP